MQDVGMKPTKEFFGKKEAQEEIKKRGKQR